MAGQIYWYLEKKWLLRFLLFSVFFSLLVLIKNEFFIVDEYWYAINLDQGFYASSETPFIHIYHVLSNICAYLVWFLTSILGIEVSAFRALQITSCAMAACGAVALVDLGLFWGAGLSRSILFSFPVILTNGFIRYGTSAFPDAIAMGAGLIAINMLIRAVDAQRRSAKNKVAFRPLFISGVLSGIGALMHMVYLTLVPGLIFGIVLGLYAKKQSLRQILGFLLSYILGLALVLGAEFIILSFIIRSFPHLVYLPGYQYYNSLSILAGRVPAWFPSPGDFITGIKTFGALFIPGVHSQNRLLDLLFNIPRIMAVILFVWIFLSGWRNKKYNKEIFFWVIPLLLSIAGLFFAMVFTRLSFCRQYACIGYAALGPLFMILAISVRRKREILISVLSLALLFYMVFGIEGLVKIVNHDSRPMRKLYRKCDVHRPKFVQFPWKVDKRSLDPGCRLVHTYGSEGPGLDYLEKEVD